jgi:hypothetical protein
VLLADQADNTLCCHVVPLAMRSGVAYCDGLSIQPQRRKDTL